MRIRSIHPQFWRSDDIAALRRDQRLLFIGLWSYVDDNGVGLDDYRHIAADLFAPEDDQSGARKYVRDGLATLSAGGMIVRYTDGDKHYLYIPTWDKWQRVDRPGKPRYPRPDECGATLTSENGSATQAIATPSRHPRDTPSTGEGEKGRRGEGEKRVASETDDDTTTPRPDIDRLCTHLAERIEANGAKRPTIGKRWRDAARLMLDRDEYTEDQIHKAIDWCQDDEFWRSNILSMSKLREKYDQLRLQATRNGSGAASRRQQETDAWYQRSLERAQAKEAAMQENP